MNRSPALWAIFFGTLICGPASAQMTTCRTVGQYTYCDTPPPPVQYVPPPTIQQFNVAPLLEQATRLRALRAQEELARQQAENNRLQAEVNALHRRQLDEQRRQTMALVAAKEQEEIARDGEAGRRRVETRRILADLLASDNCSSAIALADRDGDEMMRRVAHDQCDRQ